MLKLIPTDLITKHLEMSEKKASDLHLLLLIINSGLREVHPVFNMCVQVNESKIKLNQMRLLIGNFEIKKLIFNNF